MHVHRVLACVVAPLLLLACGERAAEVKTTRSSVVAKAETSAPVVTETAAAPEAAPINTAPAVPEADVVAMAASDYGDPTTRIEPALKVQRWIQDGGGREDVRASEGRRFLVVEFPQTATMTPQLFYDSRQVSLRIGSERLPVYAVTTGGASARNSAIAPDGRRVFQREVYASHYAPAADLPFAIAFEIPADATSGTLTLGQRESALSW